ncbi:MAG: hypothetical protein V4671_18600 [Armatimonadota bacterium]
MFAAPTPHPLEVPVLVVVLLSTLLLLVGAITAPRWRGRAIAAWVRSLALIIALGVTIAFEVISPSLVLEALARSLTIWPACVLAVVFFGVWTWRGHQR